MQYLWYRLIKSNKKLKFYSTFKQVFKFEQHLDSILYYKNRKLLTKFRCSNHQLEIEKGRHKKTPKKERLCQLCAKQVETKKHYLTFCPLFKSIRKSALSASWFADIKSNEIEKVSSFIAFLRNAEKIRKTHLKKNLTKYNQK